MSYKMYNYQKRIRTSWWGQKIGSDGAHGENSDILAGVDNITEGDNSGIVSGEGNLTSANNSSVVAGENNQTQGLNSAILAGKNHIVVGADSSILSGDGCRTGSTAVGSVSLGYKAVTALPYQVALGSSGIWSTAGKCQLVQWVASCVSVDGTRVNALPVTGSSNFQLNTEASFYVSCEFISLRQGTSGHTESGHKQMFFNPASSATIADVSIASATNPGAGVVIGRGSGSDLEFKFKSAGVYTVYHTCFIKILCSFKA